MPDPPASSPRRGARRLRLVAALAAALFTVLLIARASASASRAALEERAAAKLAEIEGLEASGDVAEADRIAAAAWDLVADEESFEGATEELAFRALAARLQAGPSGGELEELAADVEDLAASDFYGLRAALLEIGLAEARAGEPLPADGPSWDGIDALLEEREPGPFRRDIAPLDLEDVMGVLLLRDDHVLRGPLDALIAREGVRPSFPSFSRARVRVVSLPPRWTLGGQEQLAESLANVCARGVNPVMITNRVARERALQFAPALESEFGDGCERLLERARESSITDEQFHGAAWSLAFVTQSPLVMIHRPVEEGSWRGPKVRESTLDWFETVRKTARLPRSERTMARALGAVDAIIEAKAHGLSSSAYGIDRWLQARLSLRSLRLETDLAQFRSELAQRSMLGHLSSRVHDDMPDVLELTVDELVLRASALPANNHHVRRTLYEIACTRADEAAQPYPSAPLTSTGMNEAPRHEMPDRWVATNPETPIRRRQVDVAVLRWAPADAVPEVQWTATVTSRASRSASVSGTVESSVVRSDSSIPWVRSRPRGWTAEDAEFSIEAVVADAAGRVRVSASYGNPRRDVRDSGTFGGLGRGYNQLTLDPGVASVLFHGGIAGGHEQRDLYAVVAMPRRADEPVALTAADWAIPITARLDAIADEMGEPGPTMIYPTYESGLWLGDRSHLLIAGHLSRTLANPPAELEMALAREPIRQEWERKTGFPWDPPPRPHAVAQQRSEAGVRVGGALAVLLAVLLRRRWFLLVSLAAIAAVAIPWTVHWAAPDMADARWIGISAFLGVTLARHARSAGAAPIGGALVAAALAGEALAAHGIAAEPARALAALLFLGGALGHALQGQRLASEGRSLRGSGAAWIIAALTLPAATANLLVLFGSEQATASRLVPGLDIAGRSALFVVSVLCAAFGAWFLENLKSEWDPARKAVPTDA